MVKIKKIKIKKNKKTALKKTHLKNRRAGKSRAKVALRTQPGRNLPDTQEAAVGTAKFFYPEACRIPKNISQELPSQYGVDKIVLMVRDPWWLHAYWELKNSTLERLKFELKDEFYKAKRILRVYDVTNIIFNGTNANRFFDIQIDDFASSWYIDAGAPGRFWCIDLGLILSNGRFITILRSNVVQSPLDGPSWITDEEWMIPDDMFARLYGMGFGEGKSSPLGKDWRGRIISSPGITSPASPVKKAVK